MPQRIIQVFKLETRSEEHSRDLLLHNILVASLAAWSQSCVLASISIIHNHISVHVHIIGIVT